MHKSPIRLFSDGIKQKQGECTGSDGKNAKQSPSEIPARRNSNFPSKCPTSAIFTQTPD
ncbi:hypothetical protein [Neisseria lactamica]|uniref:hypothetical protein n=1 Tax=Neisseria lactamica TaxID=486 RepID=UPI0002ECC82B|nr:hypothetical protein [Neisseria lactamica]